MSAKRVFYGLVVLSFILCGLIIGAAVFGNTVFKKQFIRLSELKAKSQVLEQQSLSLIKAKKDIEQYDSLNEVTKQIVPQDKDQARTVREISKIAQESGIRLSSISFEPSTLGDVRLPASSSATTSGETTAPPTTANAALTQVKPVPGIPGVYSLGISVQTGEENKISYSQFLTFLEKLESNRRTAHVGRISVTPDDNGSNVTFALTLNAYVKP